MNQLEKKSTTYEPSMAMGYEHHTIENSTIPLTYYNFFSLAVTSSNEFQVNLFGSGSIDHF